MRAEILAFAYGAAGRWLTYLSVIAIVGNAGFVLFVRKTWRARANHRARSIESTILRVGLAAAFVLLGATAWRLYAQANSSFGLNEPLRWSHVRIVAFDTAWGSRWLWQMGASVVAALLFVPTKFLRRHETLFTVTAAVAVTVVVPLTGHAVSREGAEGLSFVLQVVHVLSVGLWIGTLLVIMTLAVPAGRDAFVAAIRAFSPLAIVAVATLAASGLLTSIVYLESISQLWSGAYGRVLVLKLCLFGAVAGFGAYNWRRLRPVLDASGSAHRMKRTAVIELCLAGLTLALTAVLVALPLGHD